MNDQIIPGKNGIAQFYKLVEQSVLDTFFVVYSLATPLKAFEGDSTGNTEHPKAAKNLKGSMATPSRNNPAFIKLYGSSTVKGCMENLLGKMIPI